MAIYNQVGLTTLNTNPSAKQTWTGNTGVEFVLDAVDLSGAPLALPTPTFTSTGTSNATMSPVAFGGAISAWVQYKAEVFLFSNVSATVPDQIIYVRAISPTEAASAGLGKPWPSLASAYIDKYLRPTGSAASQISTAAQPISWTSPESSYVTSGYLFSSNANTATNSQNETASFGKRSRRDYFLGQYGDTGVNVGEFANSRSGSSMAAPTSSDGTNPNPRCGDSNLVALSATDSTSYREAGLSFRDSNRKVHNAVWFWVYP